jgi:hypothetical protein
VTITKEHRVFLHYRHVSSRAVFIYDAPVNSAFVEEGSAAARAHFGDGNFCCFARHVLELELEDRRPELETEAAQ